MLKIPVETEDVGDNVTKIGLPALELLRDKLERGQQSFDLCQNCPVLGRKHGFVTEIPQSIIPGAELGEGIAEDESTLYHMVYRVPAGIVVSLQLKFLNCRVDQDGANFFAFCLGELAYRKNPKSALNMVSFLVVGRRGAYLL
jgi:hypothetical protein